MSKKKDNTPRRKRLSRIDRLAQAKKWIKQYEGKNVVRGYRNWFGVDLLCAIKELEMIGHPIKESYKKEVKESIEANRKRNAKRKWKAEQKELEYTDWDDDFLFVAGYTSNGVPFKS